MENRILDFYERRSRTWLLRKVPVIVRLDGKCFHSFCRNFEKPYDLLLNECLTNTLVFLCKKIQGVVYGQRHSDEISLLLLDLQHPNSEACFDYNVQKISSVIAGMCSVEFCRQLLLRNKLSLDKEFPSFDGRAFNLPEFEVVNYFWDRSLDCVRNSVQNLARTKFSHKQLHAKNNSDMQEMLYSGYNINWANLPQEQKSGVYCYKTFEERQMQVPLSKLSTHFSNAVVQRSIWKTNSVPSDKKALYDILKSYFEILIDRINLTEFNKGNL